MDLSKPHLIFSVTWLITFTLSALVQTNLSVPFTPAVYIIVFGSMAVFYFSYEIWRILLPRRVGTARFPDPTNSDLAILSKYLRLLFVLWVLGFSGTILWSGGIPIYWKFIGDPRNYIDFGMPSVSGLMNMLRCFIFAGVVALHLKRAATGSDYALAAICFASALAEISRGSLIAIILHGVAMVALLRPITWRQVGLGLLGLWIVLSGFEFIGNNRTVGYDQDFSTVLGGDFENGGFLSRYIWTFIYITSPFNNLAFALSQNFAAPMTPYYTLQPLIPTVIRSVLFKPGDYPIELLNEAFNATTAYAPLVADFGPWIAMLIFSVIAIICNYSYVRAKNGEIFHQLIYPAIFTSVALSFFYSYFFALPIVLYPTVAWGYVIYSRRARARLLREAQGRVNLRAMA